MTDWRTMISLTNEVQAGNNIKMPFGYPDQAEHALQAYEKGELSIETLRENAYYVLKSVMKTNGFRIKDFGKKHILGEGETEISAIDVNGLSCTRILQATREDGCEYLYHLGGITALSAPIFSMCSMRLRRAPIPFRLRFPPIVRKRRSGTSMKRMRNWVRLTAMWPKMKISGIR